MLGLAAITMALTAGCDRRDDSPFGMDGEAAISLSLAVDYAEKEMTLGTKNQMPVIDPHKDLKIHIENSNKDTLARWTCFDDVPSEIRFKPGAYKVVAEWGNEKQIPAFDTYSYRAEEKFVIKAGDNLHIDLTAKLATTKISVEFDSNFGFYYQDYAVNVRTVGVDSLRFAKDETRCGYFEPGSVRLRFDLVLATGEILSFSPEPLVKASAADYYKLKLKVSSDAGSGQVIIVSTDETTNGDPNGNKIITIEIPKYFLPKDKPTFTDLKGFTSGVNQSLFEGEKAEWSLKANVPGGIASFVIRVNDPSGPLAAKLGGQTVIDLASLPTDSPLREVLRQAGFVWSPGLNSPEDASISATAWLDFTDVMVAQSDGNTAQYDFHVEVTDNYNQTPDGGQCAVKAEIKVPTVTFTEPVPGNMWATKGEFTIKANYDLVNGASPVLQFRRKTGTGVWNDAIKVTPENPDGDVTITSQPNEGGNYVAQYVLKGLQPNTEYEFQVVLNNRVSVPTHTVWKTETATGIPGLANGEFAPGDWRTSTTALGVTVYLPPAGWACRNALTTSQTSASVNSDSGSGEDPVSEMSANNGTMLIQNPANFARKAVQLQTTGWGRGTYAKTGGDVAGSKLTGGGAPALGARIRNSSAGVLYLGTHSYTAPLKTGTETMTYHLGAFTGGNNKKANYPYELFNGETGLENTGTGIEFAVRPASIKFQYMFTRAAAGAHGFLVRAEVYAENGTKIGEAVLSPDVAEQAAMTQMTVPFVYSDHILKAKTLKLLFSSDTDLSVGTSTGSGVPGGPSINKKASGMHTGNTVVIDNVELGYDF